MVAVCASVIVPVVAGKVTVVEFAGTLTEAGKVSTLAMAPEMSTEAPPAGAAAGKVTVQVVLVLEAKVGVVHWRNAACMEPDDPAVDDPAVNVIQVPAI